MDPFSAAASSFAVIQIADRLVGLCKSYITGVIDCPNDLRAILIEVGAVKCVLEVIELLKPSPNEKNEVRILEKIQAPLEGCRDTLLALEKLFPSQSGSTVRGKRQKITLSLARLAWPLKKENAQKLLDELGRHKATISLALTAESTQDIKNIKAQVEEIRQTTEVTEFHEILKWLVTTDPSSNHNSACRLHEDHTGEWLTRSSEHNSWKNGSERFLWLHGIPGAGKTVLLSYIIKDIKDFCGKSPGYGWSYYYCHFERSQDETSHFLRWTINQLCRQINGIPPRVRQIFRDGHQPTIEMLLEVLEAVSRNFSHVYVAIDALDESSNRETLLKTLCSLKSYTGLEHLHLVTTSRKEIDIETAIGPVANALSLSNSYVDEDIRTYVRSCLQVETKFKRWPHRLRSEIEEALVNGAQGMFRWAFCQLDILKRLNSVSEIRSALKMLPKTLDETYERILCNIADENKIIAHRTLQLLGTRHFEYVNDLHEALAFNLESFAFSEDEKPLSFLDAIEACTCLVTYNSESGYVKLAHYTVQEFLVSPRISQGPASHFQISEDFTKYFLTSCFICKMLEYNQKIQKEESTGLMSLAIDWLSSFTPEDMPKSNINETSMLFLKLLDSRRPGFQLWLRQMAAEDSQFPMLSVNVGDEQCLTLAYLCYLRLVDAILIFLELNKPHLHTLLTKHIFHPTNKLDSINLRFDYGLRNGRSGTRASLYINSFPTKNIGVPLLHLAALFDSDYGFALTKLLTLEGCDINQLSYAGSTLFASLFGVDTDPFKKTNIPALYEFLLTNNARLDTGSSPIACLQVVLQSVTRHAETLGAWSSIYLPLIQRLLDQGIGINEVANDESNIDRIRKTHGRLMHDAEAAHDESNMKRNRRNYNWLTDENKPLSPEDQTQLLSKAIRERGKSEFYDTPLRILEGWEKNDESQYPLTSQYLSSGKGISSKSIYERIKILKNFLVERGAVSLHLFPIKGLPGYVEEDIEEWRRLNEKSIGNEVTDDADTSQDLTICRWDPGSSNGWIEVESRSMA